MKQFWIYLMLVCLAISCVNTQQTNYADAFQHTTIEENTQWLQDRLTYERKSFIDEQKTIKTISLYDSSTKSLSLYYKDLTDTSSIRGVRFNLVKLRPENVVIDESYTPATNKREYVIFIKVPKGDNAIESIQKEGGQEKVQVDDRPQGISLPAQINQHKVAVEEIVGRLQQTILLLKQKQG